MISSELAQVLQAERSELNRLFELSRRQFPGLDGPEFLSTFGFITDEAFQGAKGFCEKNLPNRALLPAQGAALVKTLFEILLEFSGNGILGKSSQNTGLDRALAQLLAAFPRAIMEKPDPFIRSVTNAWLNVTHHSPVSLSCWLEKILKLAPLLPGYEDFLSCGTIAAWLSGMTQFREPALRALAVIPEPLFFSLLNLPAVDTPLPRGTFLEKLSLAPWIDPAALWLGQSQEKVYYTFTGGFADFSGVFTDPPVLLDTQDRVMVRAGEQHYELLADRFGTALLPCGGSELPPAKNDTPTVCSDGQYLKIGEKKFDFEQVESLQGNYAFPDFREVPVSSQVLSRGTIYITSPLSYKIFILSSRGSF